MIELVGRGAEVAAIARFVARVSNGPVGLLIEGEPGIGKTTVVLEAARMARSAGHRIIQARPAEAEADLSFAALTDLIGGAVDEVAGALPPPQRAALDVALLRRAGDAAADPRTTASALLAILTELASRGPLVMVIDDAQWLDRASRRALEFAVRRLPPGLGIVVARRPVADPAPPLDLARALAVERIEHLVLGPLSVAAENELLRSRLGVKLARPLLVRVAEASGGNPLFALEIAGAIARAGTAPGPGEPLPVPPTLHHLLDERTQRLSAPARLVAAAAAALSRPTAEVLETALGSEVDVAAALIEADEAGLLTVEGDRLRFSHPLFASTLYGSLAVTRRRDLHRRLAAAAGDAEERARHLARAQRTPEAAAAAAVEDAAALALHRGAPDAAAELYAAACRLTPSDGSDDLARRMLGGAHALRLAGDLDAARSRAAQALETAASPATRARALLLLGDLATYTDSIEARIAYQERALAEAGEDRALRTEILLALFEEVATDPERAGQRADEAIELLRGAGDRALLARALTCKFVAEAVLGHGAQRELLAEALDLDDGPESIYPLIWAHWIDDLDGARDRFRRLRRAFEDRGDIVGAAELVEFVAMAEFRAGSWAEAERALEAACETLAQVELRGPVIASFADRSVIDAHRGRPERARATLRAIVAVPGLDRFWGMVARSAEGAVAFCHGSYEEADRAWRAMREDARALGWKDNLDDRSEPDHVEALVTLGRLDEARAMLDLLAWRAQTLPRRWIDATLPRARAVLAAGEGDPSTALAILEAAPSIPELPFEAARLLLLRGQLERRLNRKLAAKASLTLALEAFQALGSPPWGERAADELARIGLRHRDARELTEGERRIAELAASGMTNREVAQAAFVSPKTVEANLARVYQKLGIRSRAELGARIAPGVEEA